ncbi:MAG: ATP-binding cassette domain-containing protein, partial [Rhodospirillaceae bacterium]|nr:ATP-binding cassette domain-containing protein [Rhodospirillaceae bacterium]
EGRAIENLATEDIVNAGIALVPEGRRLFSRLSVQENLMAGAYLSRCRSTLKERLDEIYALFPVLAERRRQIVSQMSGGEQQMVAIGRALMSSPTLILFDELSLGLAPFVVDDIYRKVSQIHELGVTAIVIEQDMKRALHVASHLFVMLEGHVVLEGKPADVTEEQVSAAYFGTGIEGLG